MKKIKLVASMLLMMSFVFAQESNIELKPALKITVDEAVDLALKNNKKLKSSQIDLEIAKRANDYSWNTFMPTLGVSGTLARSNNLDSIKGNFTSGAMLQTYAGAMASGASASDAQKAMNSNYSSAVDSMIDAMGYKSDEEMRWHPVGSVTLGWNFNLAMVESIKVTKAKYEQGKITWEQAVSSMNTDIRKIYYGILLQQESLRINEESLANAKARYDQATINYHNGLVPELQVLNSQVSYENKKPEILKASQSLKQQKELFAFMLGLPFGTDIELTGSIDPQYVRVDADELYKDYIENNNDVRNLKKSIELCKHGINATRFKTYTPSFSFNYSYSPTVSVISKSWIDEDNYSDGGSMSFTLVYSNLFDMFPWGSNMQSLKDMKAQLAQAELGLEQIYQNTEIEVHKLVDNLSVCEGNIQAMERNVEVAEKAYESTLKAFNNGTQEWLSVRESDSSLSQAKLGLMNEKFNYISALLDLEQKLNIKLR